MFSVLARRLTGLTLAAASVLPFAVQLPWVGGAGFPG